MLNTFRLPPAPLNYFAVFFVSLLPVVFLCLGHCLISVMNVVLICHSIEFRGSLPRFEILTFRRHALQHRDIPLARDIAVSPWLGGSGCALPCFGFIGLRCFCVGPVVGLSD